MSSERFDAAGSEPGAGLRCRPSSVLAFDGWAYKMNASEFEVACPSVGVFNRHNGSHPAGNDRLIRLRIVGCDDICAAIRIG